MTATTLAPAPAVQRRPRMTTTATALVAAASVMFFAGLIGIYLTRRAEVVAKGADWLPEGVKIPLTQSNVMLFTILSASIIVQWAAHAVRRDDRYHSIMALGLTLVLGAAFINMESYLFELMKFDISADSQSVMVYAILGGQLIMLIAAMAFVAVGLVRVVATKQTVGLRDTVSSAAMFWHATSAVYFLIWIAILVTK